MTMMDSARNAPRGAVSAAGYVRPRGQVRALRRGRRAALAGGGGGPDNSRQLAAPALSQQSAARPVN